MNPTPDLARLKLLLEKVPARPWRVEQDDGVKNWRAFDILSGELTEGGCFVAEYLDEQVAEVIVSLANLADRLLSTLEAETERRVSAEGALEAFSRAAKKYGKGNHDNEFAHDVSFRIGVLRRARAHFSRFTSESTTGDQA